MKFLSVLIVLLSVFAISEGANEFTFSSFSPLTCPSGDAPFAIEHLLCSPYVTRGCCPLDPAVAPDPTSTTTSIDAALSTLSVRCKAALLPLLCETKCAPYMSVLLTALSVTFTGTQDSVISDAISVTCPSTCALIQSACTGEITVTCPTSTAVPADKCVGSGFPSALATAAATPAAFTAKVQPHILVDNTASSPSSPSPAIAAAQASAETKMATTATPCLSVACLTPAQAINIQGWTFLNFLLSRIDAYVNRPYSSLESALGFLRAEVSPTFNEDPFANYVSIIWFVAGVVMFLLIILSQYCTRTTNNASRVAPDQVTCHITPSGVAFDAATSKAFLGLEQPPDNLVYSELHEVSDLQRGQLFAKPLLTRAWLPFLGALLASVIWILVVLSPLFMDTIQGTILGYRALPPDLFACAVLSSFALGIIHWAFAKIGDRTFVSLVPLTMSIIAGILAVPLLSYFLARAATCIERNGFAKPAYDMDCDGAAITLIMSAIWLLVTAYLTFFAAKMWGFGRSQPSILNQPGLPVVFSETHQRFLLTYLDSTSMNTKPEKAPQMTLAEARRSAMFSANRTKR